MRQGPTNLQGLNTYLSLQGNEGGSGLDLSSAFSLGADAAGGGAEDPGMGGGMVDQDGGEAGLGAVSPMLVRMMQEQMAGGEDDSLTSEDKGLALAQAGFGMAAGESPHALTNIGAGAVGGIQALSRLKQQRAIQRMRESQQAQTAAIQTARLEQQAQNAQGLQEYRKWLAQNGMQDNERAQAQFAETKRHNLAMEANAAAGRDAGVQQTDPIQLEDGTIVLPRFNKDAGEYEYKDPETDKWRAVPSGARRVTPSIGAPLNRMQFEKKENEFLAESEGVRKMNAYLGTVKDSKQGFGLMADQFMAKAKTLFDSGELDPSELATEKGKAKLQALLGANRIEIVGPGVLTEYDAQRVLQALGGDVNKWRNKEVVQDVMRDIYNEKLRRAGQLRDQIIYSANTYGKKAEDYVIPDAPNFNTAPAAPAAGARPAGPSLEERLNKYPGK